MTGLDHKLAVIPFETRPKAKKKTQKLSLLLRNPAVLLGFSIIAFAGSESLLLLKPFIFIFDKEEVPFLLLAKAC